VVESRAIAAHAVRQGCGDVLQARLGPFKGLWLFAHAFIYSLVLDINTRCTLFHRPVAATFGKPNF